MNKINAISINEKGYKSLKNFIWDNIPNFVIITGLNGSGKTHLLECLAGLQEGGIYDGYFSIKSDNINLKHHNNTKTNVFYIDVSHKPDIEEYNGVQKISLQGVNNSYNSYNTNQEPITRLITEDANDLDAKIIDRLQENIIDFYENKVKPNIIPDTNSREYALKNLTEELNIDIEDIAKALNDLRKKYQNKTIQYLVIIAIYSYLDFIYQRVHPKRGSGSGKLQLNDVLSRLIVMHHKCNVDLLKLINQYEENKFITINDSYDLKKMIEDYFNQKEDPVNLINSILNECRGKYKKQFNLKYSLKYDGDILKKDYKGIIYLLDLDTQERRDFKYLSSGEKIIISLLIKFFTIPKLKCVDTIIIDEFDAHLNPQMSQMYIDIIYHNICKKYLKQVIMSTHSPSTVAYAPDDSLFWMENGKILFKEDEKLSKSDILEYLSDGMTIIDDDFFINTTKLMSANQKDCIIFMEEKSGKRHLENAMQCFGFNYTNVIFPCGGASKILPWFQMPINPNKKIIILDNDEEGKIAYDKIKSKYPESKILFITGKDYYDTLDQTKVIEDLIDIQYYENRRFNSSKSKVNFANVLSKKSICDKQKIYIKFKMLIELIFETNKIPNE